ncbi:hypothetical protein ACFXHD_13855 [Streptomyces hydrogenans]|uniref:hypothetical protein n=1 Tax=Streptomyces hydrogenans TaxID=1873719 RepID=UPI003682699E
MSSNVFSAAVRQRNLSGMTYVDMESLTWEIGGKEGSRSSAWWNNMANERGDTPPAPKYLPGIIAVLGLPERRVQELISEQWYGVRPDDRIPSGLNSIVATLRGVSPEDLAILQPLAQALSDKWLAEILNRSREETDAEAEGPTEEN